MVWIDPLEPAVTKEEYATLRRLRAGELVAVEAWRPIETAPKDGQGVLLWLGGLWQVYAYARWFEPWGRWLRVGDIIPSTYEAETEEPWGIGCAVPTHWMPLPAPPAAKEEGNG